MKIMLNVREKFFGSICSCPWTVSRCFYGDHDMRSSLLQKKNILEMNDCKSEKYIPISEGEKKRNFMQKEDNIMCKNACSIVNDD
jgi:hypothetical protein